MGTDTLKNYVLALADADNSLSEPARLAVLAALEDPDVLSEALGAPARSVPLAESLTAADEAPEEPVGAYLASITVRAPRHRPEGQRPASAGARSDCDRWVSLRLATLNLSPNTRTSMWNKKICEGATEPIPAKSFKLPAK